MAKNGEQDPSDALARAGTGASPAQNLPKIAPIRLWLCLLLLLALLAVLQLWHGDLILTQHEGDTLHLMDMLLRLELGQRIHQDFHTPLGALALLPFSAALGLGVSGGLALPLGQLLLALALSPVIAWTCAPRLPRIMALGLSSYLILLISALIDGGTEPNLGLSMSYNRWAWAVTYLVLLPVFLPLRSPKGCFYDGTLIGAGFVILALLKATYALALAPVLILALLLRGDRRTFAAALMAAALGALLASLWFGFDLWPAYFSDLQAVAASPLRTWPSRPIDAVVLAPSHVVANLLLLAGVIILRRAGALAEGLLLLALLPALLYIVAQNFGNDPQWLLLLAVILISVGAEGETQAPKKPCAVVLEIGVPKWGGRREGVQNWAFRAVSVAAMALALALPSVINLLGSSPRQFLASRAEAEELLPQNAQLNGLLIPKTRRETFRATRAIDVLLAEDARIGPADAVPFQAQSLPYCELGAGFEQILSQIAKDLTRDGFGDQKIWMADLLNPLWLIGPMPPVTGNWPWSYGGLDGLDDSDLLLLPTCPVNARVFRNVVSRLQEVQREWIEVKQASLYALYRRADQN